MQLPGQVHADPRTQERSSGVVAVLQQRVAFQIRIGEHQMLTIKSQQHIAQFGEQPKAVHRQQWHTNDHTDDQDRGLELVHASTDGVASR